MFEHVDFVGNRDCQRSSGTTFTNYHCDNRHRQPGHLKEVAGNGLRLTALLSAQAGICTRSVNQCQNRAIEFRRELPKSFVGKVLRRVLVEEENKVDA